MSLIKKRITGVLEQILRMCYSCVTQSNLNESFSYFSMQNFEGPEIIINIHTTIFCLKHLIIELFSTFVFKCLVCNFNSSVCYMIELNFFFLFITLRTYRDNNSSSNFFVFCNVKITRELIHKLFLYQ